jgi:MarR-like DNA-binding transcriptional regulator SgrR of sgrS sRNA
MSARPVLAVDLLSCGHVTLRDGTWPVRLPHLSDLLFISMREAKRMLGNMSGSSWNHL